MNKMIYIVAVGMLGSLLFGCASAAATNEVMVEVNEQGYQPLEVTVVVGKDTRLTLRNTSTEEHELGIHEIPLATRGGGDNMAGHNMDGTSDAMATPLQLHIVTAAGANTSLDFTPTKVGKYEFRCQIEGHSEIGTLVVARSTE